MNKKVKVQAVLKRSNIIAEEEKNNENSMSQNFDIDDVDEDVMQDILLQLKNKKKPQPIEKKKTKKVSNRKHTEDGLPVYTAQELKIGLPNSGNTPLCPFDCECCF